MSRFRPCIDLHQGSVKQIVGGTLTDAGPAALRTNHVSAHPAAHFARLYRDHGLVGAHVIMLGPGNEDAARDACAAWPGMLQVGGGITAENARRWVREWGAEKVIVTSYLFPDARFSMDRLQAVLAALDNDRSKLVIDLSCRRVRAVYDYDDEDDDDDDDRWAVAMNKWQTLTDMKVNKASLSLLAPYCSEFLVHAADAEGLQRGMDEQLVRRLAEWSPLPVTYAGGARCLRDLYAIESLSNGRVDLTIGSALDIFGGEGVRFEDCVQYNRRKEGREQ